MIKNLLLCAFFFISTVNAADSMNRYYRLHLDDIITTKKIVKCENSECLIQSKSDSNFLKQVKISYSFLKETAKHLRFYFEIKPFIFDTLDTLIKLNPISHDDYKLFIKHITDINSVIVGSSMYLCGENGAEACTIPKSTIKSERKAFLTSVVSLVCAGVLNHVIICGFSLFHFNKTPDQQKLERVSNNLDEEVAQKAEQIIIKEHAQSELFKDVNLKRNSFYSQRNINSSSSINTQRPSNINLDNLQNDNQQNNLRASQGQSISYYNYPKLPIQTYQSQSNNDQSIQTNQINTSKF